MPARAPVARELDYRFIELRCWAGLVPQGVPAGYPGAGGWEEGEFRHGG